jgi:hypothetical protein
LAASSDQNPSSPVNSNERTNNRRRPSKRTKDDDTNQSNEISNSQNEDNEEWNGFDNLDNDEDEDDEEAKNKKKKQKKSYPMTHPVRIRKPVEKEILIEDPTQIPPVSGIPLEPLSKHKRQPAQERLFDELSAINERIASLIQVRQMGLSTPENKKQLKQLMRDRDKKAFALKRLQSKQRSSNRYRIKKKKIVNFFFFKFHNFSLFCFRLNIYMKQNQNYIHN